jgi:protein-tyrosine phosphatase
MCFTGKVAAVKVLFVCTGNICRSPTAEGVLREMARKRGVELHVESRGTHDYHVGDPPDERAQEHAKRRGYDLSAQRARHLAKQDFDEFDLILAMDHGHLRILQRLCPPQHSGKVRLFIQKSEVPDPYYGGPEGFEQVLDLVEAACRDLLAEIP